MTAAAVGVEHVLDLLGRDVLALADDDVLHPAGEDQVPVRSQHAEVAGPESAPSIEGLLVEAGIGVTREEHRSLHPHLALHSSRRGSLAAVG